MSKHNSYWYNWKNLFRKKDGLNDEDNYVEDENPLQREQNKLKRVRPPRPPPPAQNYLKKNEETTPSGVNRSSSLHEKKRNNSFRVPARRINPDDKIGDSRSNLADQGSENDFKFKRGNTDDTTRGENEDDADDAACTQKQVPLTKNPLVNSKSAPTENSSIFKKGVHSTNNSRVSSKLRRSSFNNVEGNICLRSGKIAPAKPPRMKKDSNLCQSSPQLNMIDNSDFKIAHSVDQKIFMTASKESVSSDVDLENYAENKKILPTDKKLLSLNLPLRQKKSTVETLTVDTRTEIIDEEQFPNSKMLPVTQAEQPSYLELSIGKPTENKNIPPLSLNLPPKEKRSTLEALTTEDEITEVMNKEQYPNSKMLPSTQEKQTSNLEPGKEEPTEKKTGRIEDSSSNVLHKEKKSTGVDKSTEVSEEGQCSNTKTLPSTVSNSNQRKKKVAPKIPNMLEDTTLPPPKSYPNEIINQKTVLFKHKENDDMISNKVLPSVQGGINKKCKESDTGRIVALPEKEGSVEVVKSSRNIDEEIKDDEKLLARRSSEKLLEIENALDKVELRSETCYFEDDYYILCDQLSEMSVRVDRIRVSGEKLVVRKKTILKRIQRLERVLDEKFDYLN